MTRITVFVDDKYLDDPDIEVVPVVVSNAELYTADEIVLVSDKRRVVIKKDND